LRLMISAISAALVSLATSSLDNRTTLEIVRNREYAADGAIEQAVAVVRNPASGYDCSSPGGFVVDTLNSTTIRVDWVSTCAAAQSAEGTVVSQRNVVFTACENTGTGCAENAVIIRAQVNFEQAAGSVTKTYVQSWSVNR
jgi:hypothetical protein